MDRLISLMTMLLWASNVQAEAPMTAVEFDAYVTGKTLTFDTPGGDFYGVEQYRKDRQVVWQAEGGPCVEGVWFEKGGNICFLYETDPEPKCWAVFKTKDGIRAEFQNRPGTPPITETLTESQPLSCPEPELLG